MADEDGPYVDGQEVDPDAALDSGLESIFGWLDTRDWLKRDGFYRAVVSLGDRDSATVCVAPHGAATKVLQLLRGRIELLGSIQGAERGDLASVLVQMLGDKELDDLWDVVREALACCLVDWTVPGLAGLPLFDAAPGVPNAKLPAAERDAIIDKIPLSLIVRILLAILWLSKNC